MLLALLLSIFLLCLYRMRVRFDGFHEDYLDKPKTDSIKGIFILLIVLSHSLGYMNKAGYTYECFGDAPFLWFFNHLSQLVVAMFLFYSGYGVNESFKRKGQSYVNHLPKRRILTTLLNFDVAVIAFIVLQLLLGTTITIEQGLLSLTGWETVGNSNWYIFIILLCYLLSYVTMRLPFKSDGARVLTLYALCIGLILLLSLYKQHYWFDTLLCYPTGVLFSTYKDRFERLFKQHYWSCAVVLTGLFLILFNCPMDRVYLVYNVMSSVFTLLIVVLTMKVGIGNNVLECFGKNLFPIYIYMRIPMIIMHSRCPELIAWSPALFILISLAITMLITRCYRYWQIRLS